jgi:hypothetical protein
MAPLTRPRRVLALALLVAATAAGPRAAAVAAAAPERWRPTPGARFDYVLAAGFAPEKAAPGVRCAAAGAGRQ